MFQTHSKNIMDIKHEKYGGHFNSNTKKNCCGGFTKKYQMCKLLMLQPCSHKYTFQTC